MLRIRTKAKGATEVAGLSGANPGIRFRIVPIKK